ncbi:MAG: universal stress protein [bacterium]
MYSSILVPLDTSEFSEDALPLARELATRLKSTLHLVHVVPPAPEVGLKSPEQEVEWMSRVHEGAAEYLNEVANRDSELDVRTGVLQGRPVPTLARYVQDHDISLVVMTSHGSGGLERWWLGSVADGLLRRGQCDVLVVRPWDETEEREKARAPRFSRLVVPLDGSGTAEVALKPALELAEAFSARVTALQVVPAAVELTSVQGVRGVRLEGEGHRRRIAEARSHLEAVAERLAGAPVDFRVVEHQSAAEGVIRTARELEADLIVMSSHGRGGLARVVLGSVADKVVRGSVLPVLVVRPPADE